MILFIKIIEKKEFIGFLLKSITEKVLNMDNIYLKYLLIQYHLLLYYVYIIFYYLD